MSIISFFRKGKETVDISKFTKNTQLVFFSHIIGSTKACNLYFFSHTQFFNKQKNMSQEQVICKACYTIPPVKSDYVPTGTTFSLQEFDVYQTGNTKSDRVVIVVYDIFGLHASTKKFTDYLGQYGDLHVLMPDIFRGKPFDESNLGDKQKLMSFIQIEGSYAKCEPVLSATIKHAVDQLGAKHIGLVGFCWGAAITLNFTMHNGIVKGNALLHPSYVQMGGNVQDLTKVQAPILMITTKDDPKTPYEQVFEVVSSLPGAVGSKSVAHRFEDMHHGFAGARGNWASVENAQRIREALQLCSNFFNNTLL